MSDIHHMAGHLIRRIHQISMSLFQERMKSVGVDLTSVQFAALSVLRENDGIDQATLAGLIAYDRATIGGVVDRLESKRFIKRETSKIDRRAKVLSLTPLGHGLLNQITPVVTALQPDILAGLSDAEKEQFLLLAERVATAGNSLSRAPLVTKDKAP